MICAFFFGEIILYINYIILLGNFVNEKCIKKRKKKKNLLERKKMIKVGFGIKKKEKRNQLIGACGSFVKYNT